jgi:hypothetical protein
MLSRAEVASALPRAETNASDATLRVLGGMLQLLGLVSIALLLWQAITPIRTEQHRVRVSTESSPSVLASSLVHIRADTVRVAVDAVPTASTRAVVRAARASGQPVALESQVPLRGLAVSVDDRWRTVGGSRVTIATTQSVTATVQDAAGGIDSLIVAPTGARRESGPVEGALRVIAPDARAAVPTLRAAASAAERVLVVGDATWESRFLVASLEEAGWLVDASLTLSPRATVTQGTARTLQAMRHAIVVVLPGAPTSVVGALPAFVRNGGGAVIVGDAARAPGVRSLLAGTPGSEMRGEVGAEQSVEPRHALDLVPIATLQRGSVAIEARDGAVAVAGRRVGAGRVVQVGYNNSWLWRMAGDDDAPRAHRRWWSTLLAGVMPQRVPPRVTVAAERDTLDAAPVAALARDVGLPRIVPARADATSATPWIAQRDPRMLLALALCGLTGAWALRRWRGLV